MNKKLLGLVVVNYADRKPGEPLAATPSVGMTKYLVYDGSCCAR